MMKMKILASLSFRKYLKSLNPKMKIITPVISNLEN